VFFFKFLSDLGVACVKGCGKSHLSKLLMVNLIGYKATVFIFFSDKN